MILECDKNKKTEILEYVGEDYPRCLYLYLDIIQYGCSSESTRSWIQKKNGVISLVCLAYHTALHLYSKDNDFDVLEVRDLVKDISPTIIIAASDTIIKLKPALSGLGFLSELGHVGEWVTKVHSINDSQIDEARADDLPEIARLLYEDDSIGASYTYDDLLNQMRERLSQGFVRSYVIRKDEKPIAHVGTGAETHNVCTIAYTIVSPNFRGLGLASQLYNQVCTHLKEEGKRIFSVYYPDSARLFHHKVGFVDVCECGKLYRNIE